MSSETLLITGAAGFIGARFVEACTQKGFSTVAVDKLSHFSDRPEHQTIPFKTMVERDSLFEWLKKNNPSIKAIVHLGACTDTTELNKAYLTQMNLTYSKQIWTYATEKKLPLIYASSAATYGDGSLGYTDDESLIPKLCPLNPYGESKQQFDMWALKQESQNQTPPAWSGFKFFNVYGFGERHKTKMSSVVIQAYDQIKATGTMKLFKSHRPGILDGHQKRDFIYIDDVISALLFALEKPIRRGIFNLGTGKAETFLDLVRPVFKTLQKPEKITFMDTPAPLRERYQYFTEAKMDKLWAEGFKKPFTPLELGVSEYVRELKNKSS